MSNYEVIVGNIGTVYRGHSPVLARKDYGDYKRQSKEGYGKAAGEPVTLLKDGEPELEYFPGPEMKAEVTNLYLHVEEDMLTFRVIPSQRRECPQTRPVYLTDKQKWLFCTLVGDPCADLTGVVLTGIVASWREGQQLTDEVRALRWKFFQQQMTENLILIPGLKKKELVMRSKTCLRVSVTRSTPDKKTQ